MLRALFGGSTFGEAVVAASSATTVGAAFLFGYRHALRALVPTLPADRVVCLCATEKGGAHPRAIATTLTETGDGWVVDGEKTWVTAAPVAQLLLVVAKSGVDEAGRNRLRVALVDTEQPGVTLTPQPPTPFVPEIAHASVRFAEARVQELLPGDGYDRYLKPFRTVEDAHVFGAVLAYLFGQAQQHDWPRPLRERIVAALASFEKVALGDSRSREIHLLLAGAIALGHQLASEATPCFADAAREAWQRDAMLLQVASKARTARAEAAWTALWSAE